MNILDTMSSTGGWIFIICAVIGILGVIAYVIAYAIGKGWFAAKFEHNRKVINNLKSDDDREGDIP